MTSPATVMIPQGGNVSSSMMAPGHNSELQPRTPRPASQSGIDLQPLRIEEAALPTQSIIEFIRPGAQGASRAAQRRCEDEEMPSRKPSSSVIFQGEAQGRLRPACSRLNPRRRPHTGAPAPTVLLLDVSIRSKAKTCFRAGYPGRSRKPLPRKNPLLLEQDSGKQARD